MTDYTVQTKFHCHAVVGVQRSLTERLVFMSGLSCFGNISLLFYAFGGIAGCGSASLKLCACDAAYPWSQSPSPDSQCSVDRCLKWIIGSGRRAESALGVPAASKDCLATLALFLTICSIINQYLFIYIFSFKKIFDYVGQNGSLVITPQNIFQPPIRGVRGTGAPLNSPPNSHFIGVRNL